MTRPKSPGNSFPAPVSSSPTVVVVDDDPHLVASLEALLGEEGYAVEGFTDPTTALERLRGGPRPDLILCDCVMPRISGGELADALVAAGIDTPIVLMTALSDPSFCVHIGQRSVLSKPFEIEDVLLELEGAASRKSGTRAREARA